VRQLTATVQRLNSVQAINSWLYRPEQADISRLRLNTEEVDILQEIRGFLEHFHLFQQQLSAEHTPTVHLVIPAVEGLMLRLELAQPQQLILKHAYDTAIRKLNEYLEKCHVNPVYTVAIGTCFYEFDVFSINISTALFPPFKLKYFDIRGSPASAICARQTFRTAVSHLGFFL
jgi:hypothetical protein